MKFVKCPSRRTSQSNTIYELYSRFMTLVYTPRSNYSYLSRNNLTRSIKNQDTENWAKNVSVILCPASKSITEFGDEIKASDYLDMKIFRNQKIFWKKHVEMTCKKGNHLTIALFSATGSKKSVLTLYRSSVYPT